MNHDHTEPHDTFKKEGGTTPPTKTTQHKAWSVAHRGHVVFDMQKPDGERLGSVWMSRKKAEEIAQEWTMHTGKRHTAVPVRISYKIRRR